MAGKVRRRPGGLTVAAVAREVGVSPITVSRVFTGNAVVAAETRARVLDAAERLGYRPNQIARSLVAARTRTLGLVLNSGLAFPGVVVGAEAAAQARGYSVITTLPSRQPETERERVETLLQRRVDGVLFISTSDLRDHEALGMLARHGVPLATVNRYWEAGDAARIFFDHQGAVRGVVRRLLAAGHRRIAFVGGEPDHPQRAVQERIAGYRSALKEAGLWDRAAEAFGDAVAQERPRLGEELTEELLRRCPGVTALLALNDAVAAGALRRLRALGRRVPDDVAVVGFDDTPVAWCTDPPLCSVRQPEREAGRVACELLIDRIEERVAEAQTQDLAASLVVRRSCGLGVEGTRETLLPLD